MKLTKYDYLRYLILPIMAVIIANYIVENFIKKK